MELCLQTFYMLSWRSTSEQVEIYIFIISNIDVNRCFVCPDILNVILFICARQGGLSVCDVEAR